MTTAIIKSGISPRLRMEMQIWKAKHEYWLASADPQQLVEPEHDTPRAAPPDFVLARQEVVVRGELIEAIRRSKYDLLEGGHAPRELRRCFDRTIRPYLEFEQELVHFRGVEVDCADFIPVLWNCMDPLPEALARALQRAEFGWLLPPDVERIYGNLARAAWEFRQGGWGTVD